MTATESAVEFNLATLIEATAERVPARPAVVHRGGELTYGRLVERSRRLARYLSGRGLGCHRERPELVGHEVGQDLMAQYLHNGPEYLEGLLGGFRARVAPFNVNYRYVADELCYLLTDARPRAIQYHARFAPALADVLPDLNRGIVLLQVADGSGHALLPGAVDYEGALASVPPDLDVEPSPDDLFVIYTGGTTGMPKGVLWRQADIAVAAIGLLNRHENREWTSLTERLDATRPRPTRMLAVAPYMHGAAQWSALQTLCEGNTVVIQNVVDRLDPADIWDTVTRHQVTAMSIVGDAFARPLIDELDQHPRYLPTLRTLISGGAALHPRYKQRLQVAAPALQIIETIGSSESGVQGRHHTDPEPGHTEEKPAFRPEAGTTVIADDLTTLLHPGHDGTGFLATAGRVPLGYLRDAAKTARTFPVIAGVRMTVPGDRARLLADGRIELLGRDSVTITTGGEKVFAEEVETVIKCHPGVADALVCGRPSQRWGSEIVALVQAARDATLDIDMILGICADRLARYKHPKEVIFVPEIVRSPSGKANYRWAAQEVGGPQI